MNSIELRKLIEAEVARQVPIAVALAIGNVQQSPKPDIKISIVKEIIDDLNEVVGTKYRSNNEITKGLVRARLQEGFTLDDFKTVHRKKKRIWSGTEYEKFLRPATLYSNKFEGYLNEIEPNLKPKKEIKPYDIKKNSANYERMREIVRNNAIKEA